MSIDRQKLARIFDALADYVEETERDKAASVNAERETRVAKLAEAYAASQGAPLPDEVRQKLAHGDPAVFALVEGLVSKQAGAVEPLGGPSTEPTDPTPTNVKEAAEAAGDRLVNWIIS